VCDDEEDLMRLHTPYHWLGSTLTMNFEFFVHSPLLAHSAQRGS
jgi:hypothetical protein